MIRYYLFAGIVFLASAGVSKPAFAFPEMVRHGYTNCTSCHVSPTGGGVLTDYGRRLSGELLSTTVSGDKDSDKTPQESRFLDGWIETPSWLDMGGDVRGIEVYRDTPQVRAYRYLFMQADLEAAATVGKFTFDLNAGDYMFQSFEARRYYVDYHATDEWSFRAGKFRQAFGLMEADHTTSVTRGLGWDEGTESYNLEAAWLGDHWNAYGTWNFGPLGSDLIPTNQKESGPALRIGRSLGESSQVGASYFHGKNDLWSRDVFGPYGVIGFSHHFFLLSEIDFQSLRPVPGGATTGWVTWDKLDYEWIQGLHGYLMYEVTRLDFHGSAISSWGVGGQWFPRPHFEFDLLWQFQSTPSFPSNTLDYATLLMHYYL